MHPDAKLLTRGYTHIQRILQIEDTDRPTLLQEINGLSESLEKTRNITWESMFGDLASSKGFESSSEGLEGDNILTRTTDVRLRGGDLMTGIKNDIADKGSDFKFDDFKSRLTNISDSLLTVGRQTHELTKGLESQMENKADNDLEM
jgi:hypothetical protein